MLTVVLIFMVCIWWVISPFLPKEPKQPVIHNVVHIVNNPVNTSTSYSAPAQADSRTQPMTYGDIANTEDFSNRIRRL